MKRIILISAFALLQFCTVQTPGTIVINGQQQTAPIQTIAAPDTPLNLSATSGNGMILLSWDESANATAYRVYDQSGNLITETTATTYNLPLQNGLFAVTAVSAINAGGESVLSVQVSAMAGIIDNHDGTISDLSTALAWTKCELGRYDAASNTCIGTAQLVQYCTVQNYYICDDAVRLTSGPAFDACAALGPGWRVPIKEEAIAFGPAFVNYQQGFTGLVDDRLWTATAVNPTVVHPSGYNAQPGNRLLFYPVRCVK